MRVKAGRVISLGYRCRLAARADGLHVLEALLLQRLVHLLQLVLRLSHHTLVQRNIMSVSYASRAGTKPTRRLQVEHIQNQEVVVGLHERRHPFVGGSRLQGEVHRHHPTVTLPDHAQPLQLTIVFTSSAAFTVS